MRNVRSVRSRRRAWAAPRHRWAPKPNARWGFGLRSPPPSMESAPETERPNCTSSSLSPPPAHRRAAGSWAQIHPETGTPAHRSSPGGREMDRKSGSSRSRVSGARRSLCLHPMNADASGGGNRILIVRPLLNRVCQDRDPGPCLSACRRCSSGVEQLIRNERVVSSILTIGSRFNRWFS